MKQCHEQTLGPSLQKMKIGQGTLICDSARVIGKVETGQDCFLLFGAVLRADGGEIRLGDRVNIQDNATLHCDPGFPTTLGNDVSVGHGAVVHGCEHASASRFFTLF